MRVERWGGKRGADGEVKEAERQTERRNDGDGECERKKEKVETDYPFN